MVGIGDMMYGKRVTSEKKSDETHDQFDQRIWREKVHLRDGQCCLTPFFLRNGLEAASKWLAMKLEGKKTFTKRFQAGVLVTEYILLTDHSGRPLAIDDVDPIRLFVPGDGRRGSSTRVDRTFPTVHEWKGRASITVFDGVITEEVLVKHLDAMGKFVGVGAMRVQNGGINGRFRVEGVTCTEMEE
jgi:hypothetical protein